MSLKIKDINNFSGELKGLMIEEYEKALSYLSFEKTKDPHKIVRKARKSILKIRAAIRIVRDTSGFYKKENQFFRNESRKMSAIRDTTAVIETLDLLKEVYKEQLYNRAFKDIRKFLEEERAKETEKFLQEPNTLTKIANQLAKRREHMAGLEINVESFDEIKPSILRVYKRGAKAFDKSKATQSAKDFHQWRKRAKYLRVQLEMMKAIWPNILDVWDKELFNLTEVLGFHRDLLMLENKLAESRKKIKNLEGTNLLTTLILGQREKLQANALIAGEKLYALKAKEFVLLIEASWKAHKNKKRLF